MDNPLVFNCSNKDTEEAFLYEAFSVMGQMASIYKNPEVPYKDAFKTTRQSVLLGAGLLILIFAMGFLLKFDVFVIVTTSIACVLFLCTLAITIFFRIAYKQFKEKFMKFEHTTLTLDNEGVKLDMEDQLTVKIHWEDVLAVRFYKESFFFFNKDKKLQSIVSEKDHKEDVLAFIKEYGINVRIIE